MDRAGNGGMDLVVFGASGDLARRKVLPAIGAVARGRVQVWGVGRSDLSRAAFQRLGGETTGSEELAVDRGRDPAQGCAPPAPHEEVLIRIGAKRPGAAFELVPAGTKDDPTKGAITHVDRFRIRRRDLTGP